jgi:hypothetical protein
MNHIDLHLEPDISPGYLGRKRKTTHLGNLKEGYK